MMTGPKLDIAVRWLRQYLRDGPKPCGDRFKPKIGTVYGDGILRDIAGMTVRRAAEELKVRREKIGRCWYWSLPEGSKKPVVRKPKRCPRKIVITISFE